MAADIPVCTTCPYCGVGCGVLASREGDGAAILGDPEHPANLGRLCSKGSALGETLKLDDRLLRPRIGGREAAWSDAIACVARGFSEIIADHGPDAVALYVSGQLLTEDYYVANKFAKGFLGTANIDTNSRLCMASSVAGHKRAFGSDTVPGNYEDLEEADLLVLVGSNFAWCHPVLFQRVLAAREKRGTRIVVIDPRVTVTAEAADLHLAIAPGSDAALFNGLLAFLAQKGAGDTAYIEAHTEGIAEALAAAEDCGIRGAADATGLDPIRLSSFYQNFCETDRVVTVYSQGVNQSSAGTDKVNAILNAHLYTGRIGRTGCGPFSITGQPNAMGGREVGGLANQLAAHMNIEDPAHRDIVSRYWNAPRLADGPGLKAVDLFRAVRRGEVKAVWIMATNPAASLPEAEEVAAGLRDCPLVVVSDVTDTTRTGRLAHVLLPAAGWGEKDGTVTNSERRISRQRAFLPLPGEAKPDWWIISQVAQAMGFPGFDYAGPAAIFREHAALSEFENDGSRDFDIGALSELSDQGYDAMKPLQWPVPRDRPGGTARLFSEGGFFREKRRARFVPTPYRPPASAPDADFPLVLNTGRVRDQWHTMTRTGKSARLFSHIAEPFVEIHPEDAAKTGLRPASLARVESARGKIIVRTLITDRQVRGSVFVPMHWSEPFAACAHPDALVAGTVDPVSGQPELKYTPVRVKPFEAAWYGTLVVKDKPDLSAYAYWALARANGGWRAEVASDEAFLNPEDLARALLSADGAVDGELLSYSDPGQGAYRFALFRGEVCAGICLLAREPVSAARTWLAERLGKPVDPGERMAILAGRPGADRPDRGAIVCACHEVGINEIAAAARCPGATLDSVGAETRAGTNCGSCRAEIARIIEATYVKKAV